jgi:DNA polymerase-3 subunit delta'
MWSVIGQDRAVTMLQRSLEKGTLAHAYLIVGQPHTGKMTLALSLAQAVNCEEAESPCGQCESCLRIVQGNHADVQVIGLSGNGKSSEARPQAEISIDQIREAQHSASLPPFEGQCRVYIIDGAEQLSNEAANCLLKTLEEPAAGVIFVLLTANDRLLPATVVSRCQRLELFPLAAADTEAALGNYWAVEPDRARLLSRLCRGCLGWAVSAVADDGLLRQRTERLERIRNIISADYEERFAYATELVAQFGRDRRQVWEVLDLWLSWWHDLLLVKVGCSDKVENIDLLPVLVDGAKGYSLAQIDDFIKSIMTAKGQLRLNASPRLVMEVLMLSIPKGDSRL